ncbi:DUF4838 domain-containing protein [Cohnella abietis]|uniref:SLH domain-containing protein n=1 Tax=Cohnella abietis TaxID=2507935 RepID=A0A3T1DCR8_9BACL|nr:DUF4838 domain-containing protein [Cohnella abietis]BBI35889.1 hypothetical protein KCTCHS21_52880 [Cohnella abietis]
MKMKKLSQKCAMFLLLISVLCSGFSSAYGAIAQSGTDVSDQVPTSSPILAASSDISGHWAEKQLLEWIDKGLVQGYSDGTLKPNNPITKGELIALTNRAMGFTEKAKISFTDLISSDPAYDDVAKAVKAGYVQGNADGTIGTKRQISRQEAAVMMIRLLKLDDTNGMATADAFRDADQIAKWAKSAVGTVAAENIMVGDSKRNFRPKASMTRAEAIVVLDRVIPLLGDHPEPTATPKPTATPGSTTTSGPAATPGPTTTPGSSPSPEPSPTPEPVPNLSIVNNGQAAAVIVVDDTSFATVASALASYVKQSSGANLPTLTTAKLSTSGNTYRNDTKIYIGRKAPGAESIIAAKLEGLNDDGYVIVPYQKTISIIGSTAWGTEIGVYDFLERYVGVRWVMPGPDGEDVPLLDDILVPAIPIREEPAAISRHFFGTEAWYTLQTTADWAKYNRMHDVIKFHHYLNVLFDPQVFANHPEYYPGGVIPTHPYAWQPCFNDDTAAAAVWRIKDFFHNFPNEKSFSLGINDSNNYCASDIARTNGKINSIGIPDLSDVYYSWVNQVVEEVLKDYPDKYFGLLAYWNVYDPPTNVKVNSHVIPYITDDRMSWIDPDMEAIGNNMTEQWLSKADNIGFYEYLFGTPYNLPRVYMHKMADNYKYAEEHGVVAHVAELFPNFGEGPKPWLSAKLQWNPNQDADLLLNEWYERTVGEDAAPYLQQYYELWEDFWTVRIFNTKWYLDWKNKVDRPNFLSLTDHRYLSAVTKEDLAESRRLMELVVAKAAVGKPKIRAEKLLRTFELYEASALSYPRGAVDAPTNDQGALVMVADLKMSFDMAIKRQQLTQQSQGDPILQLTDYSQYSGKWDGVQQGIISALTSYADTITDPDNEFLAAFQEALAYVDSNNRYSATAVKTTASKADIMAALDFSQGPWANAVPVTEFLNMKSTDAPPAETRMYLLWDDTNLYVGYENFDPDMSGAIVNDDAPNGWWRVADDSVETYVTGNVAGGYTGYFTNPKAVKFIYKSSPAGPVPGVDNNWEASANMGADRWNVIQVIPFSSIGVNPSVTKTLMGFFFRNYHGQAVFLGWGGGAPWTEKAFKSVHLVETNNLITNPSFEQSIAGQPWVASEWYSYYTDASTAMLRSSTYKRTGGYSLETSITNAHDSPFKVVSITPGKYKAVLNYFVPANSSASGSIQFQMTIRGAGEPLASSVSAARPVSWSPGRWVQFEHIFEVKPNYNGSLPDDLIFKINHSGFKADEKLYIDDVSLYKLD